ncbi:MAG: hypothetical protein ACJ71T_03875 [Actinomycetales bacterium]
MAGGMLPARGMSLEERSRLSGIAGAGSGTHRRHCWVTGPAEEPGPWPGLVVHWDRADGGWRAWVVYLVGDGQAQAAVQCWVERARLTPAE